MLLHCVKECFKTALISPLLPLVLCILLYLPTHELRAEGIEAIPSQLREWTEWVLEEDPTRGCPEIAQGNRRCVWFREAEITVRPDRATFKFSVELSAQRMVQIPGEAPWPQNVRVRSGDHDRVVPVVPRRGAPHVSLKRGVHEVSGELLWSVVPQSLLTPREMGTIALVVNGKRVSHFKRDNEGRIWLSREEEQVKGEQDTISFSIARLLQDGVPFLVDTALTMRVTGRPRRTVLHQPLPPGSLLVSYTSPLPVGFPPSGDIEIELTPGVHSLSFRTLYNTPPTSLIAPLSLTPGWPQEEYWAWQPEKRLRSIEVKGAIEVDPARVPVPGEWKTHPTYAVPLGSQIELKEVLSRALAPEEKPRYSFKRLAWIHPEGGTITVSDTLRSKENRSERLNASPELTLHRVMVDSNAIMISKDPNSGAEGIELRTKNPIIVAEGELRTAPLPAVGWQADIEELEWSVQVPAGWRLLHVQGPDVVHGSWITRWRLSHVIMVIGVVLSFALFTSLGSTVAAASFLVFPTPLITGALILILIGAGLRRWHGRSYRLFDLFLILFLTLSVADEILRLTFPSLPFASHGGQEVFSLQNLSFIVQVLLNTVSGPIGGAVILFALLISIVLFVLTRHHGAAIAGGISALALFAHILIGTSSRTPLQPKPSRQENIITRFSNDVDLLRKPQHSELSDRASHRDKLLELKRSDPNAIPQTGLGLPAWSGDGVTLIWEGRVDRRAVVELILLSPCELRLLAVIYLLSSSLLILTILKLHRTKPVSILLLISTLLATHTAQADGGTYFPSSELLSELGKRIRADQCKNECVFNPRLHLSATEEEVTIEAEVHSLGNTAWPLPGPLSSLVLQSVRINEGEASLLRESDDTLFVKLPEGVHRIRAVGFFTHPSHNVVRFKMPPGHFTHDLGPWKIGGLDDRGAPTDTLHLSRYVEGLPSRLHTERGPSPWYQVSRHLELGVDWSVTTTVKRNGEVSKPSIVEVPLLKGEVVVGGEIPVRSNTAQVAFVEGARSVSWRGELPKESTVSLESPKSEALSEVWKVKCTTIWRCSHASTIRRDDPGGREIEEIFYPYPGQRLELMVQRPVGKAGQTKTVRSAHHTLNRGSRELSGALILNILSSKRDTETVTLPQEAELVALLRGGQRLSAPLNGGSVTIPVEIGEYSYEVRWRMASSRGIIEDLPQVTFQSVTPNVTVRSDSAGRWTLWLEQEGRAPFVWWWIRLAVVLLISLVIRCVTETSPLLWFLVLVGFITIDASLILLLALILFGLHAAPPRVRLLEIGFCSAALVVAVASLHAIGLDNSRMMISGVNSDSHAYEWYLFGSADRTPPLTIISLPSWSWSIAVGLWCLSLLFILWREFRRRRSTASTTVPT